MEALGRIQRFSKYQDLSIGVYMRAGKLLALGQRNIPFQKVNSDIGKMFQFNYEKIVRYLLETFSLHKIAQTESVELRITLDDTKLT